MNRITFWKITITTGVLAWTEYFAVKPQVIMLKDALMLDVEAATASPKVCQLNTIMEVVEHLPANYANDVDHCDYSVRVARIEIGRVKLSKIEAYDVQI